jgi:hypothetical protein
MGSIRVWPNPTTSSLSVYVEAPSQAMLVDAAGNAVRSWTTVAGTTSIDVSGLAKGAYRLVLTHGLGVRAIGVIVE